MEELLDTVTCQPRARLCHVTPVYFDVNGLPFPTGGETTLWSTSLGKRTYGFFVVWSPSLFPWCCRGSERSVLLQLRLESIVVVCYAIMLCSFGVFHKKIRNHFNFFTSMWAVPEPFPNRSRTVPRQREKNWNGTRGCSGRHLNTRK